jgi:hypothetical protein
MSHPVRDKMLDLDADLNAVRFPEASTIRARGTRRARRRMIAGVTAATAVTALVGGGIAVSVSSSQGTNRGTASVGGDRGVVPEPTCVSLTSRADPALPADPSQVAVRVADATGSSSRSAELGDRLRARGFAVGGAAVPGDERSTVIRYGPSAIGAATLLDVYLDGPVSLILVPERSGREVDLVLGEPAVRLLSTTEVNQALVDLRAPARRAEVCRDRPGR